MFVKVFFHNLAPWLPEADGSREAVIHICKWVMGTVSRHIHGSVYGPELTVCLTVSGWLNTACLHKATTASPTTALSVTFRCIATETRCNYFLIASFFPGSGKSSARFQEILQQLESFKTAQVASRYDDTSSTRGRKGNPGGTPLVLCPSRLNSSFWQRLHLSQSQKP